MVFEDEITPDEEREALQEAGSLPGLKREARILVDRRRARITVGPPDVAPQMDLARSTFPIEERPRMAVLVATDHDYGMLRMLELRGGDRLPHELGVFRDPDEACAWLGTDPAVLAAAADDTAE